MNQVIKNIYRLANKEQIDYIATLADVQPEEYRIMQICGTVESQILKYRKK